MKQAPPKQWKLRTVNDAEAVRPPVARPLSGGDANRTKKIRKLITQLITKVDKRAKRFPPEELSASARCIEENPARKLYHVSITLSMPAKNPGGQSGAPRLTDSLRDAFVEIERQLEAHKATLTGDYAWKRVARRRGIAQGKE